MQRRLGRRAFLRYSAVAAAGTMAVGCEPFVAFNNRKEWTVTNVQVSRGRAPGYAEPTVAVNPRNPQNLLGAAMLLHQPAILGTFVSFDGGQTWHENGPLPLPPGRNTGDDVTAGFDAHGTGFVAAMVTTASLKTPALPSPGKGEAAAGLGTDRSVYVWRSDDGGRSFSQPVAVMHGFADRPGLAVDPTTRGAVYVIWCGRNPGQLFFSRSDDGGQSFAAPRVIIPPIDQVVQIEVITAGAEGAIHVAYQSGGDTGKSIVTAPSTPTEGATPQQPAPARLSVVTSADYGETFASAVFLGSVPIALHYPAGQRLPTGPSLAADVRSGSVYAVYPTLRSEIAPGDVFIVRSSDAGRTWSAPLNVTKAPAPTVVFQPQVVVDDTGGINVTYFALANRRVDLLLARSTDHGASFGVRRRITSQAFDPNWRPTSSARGGWGTIRASQPELARSTRSGATHGPVVWRFSRPPCSSPRSADPTGAETMARLTG